MLFFTIEMIKGTENDAEVLQECMAEWDACFEEDEPSLIVEVDELYGHIDDIDEVEGLAASIAEDLPDSEFTMKGCIDTSELAGEYMDFVIEYKNNKLISKSSCWYVQMFAEDFDEYEDFAESYADENGEPRFTEEQFEMFKEGEYFLLDSGDGDCVAEVPLDYVTEINMDEYDEEE